LSFSGQYISDAGVAALRTHRNLQHVELRASNLTDAALGYLAEIKTLTRLDLYGSGEPGVSVGEQFSSAGLGRLQDLPGLRTLCIHNLNLKGSWCAALEKFSQLESLHIDFGDIAVEELRQLRNSLPTTRVTLATGAGFLERE